MRAKGPRTPEDKRRRNALKHGAVAKGFRLMEGEDVAAYVAGLNAMAADPDVEMATWLPAYINDLRFSVERLRRWRVSSVNRQIAEDAANEAMRPFDTEAIVAAPEELRLVMTKVNLALAEAKARPSHPAAKVAQALEQLSACERSEVRMLKWALEEYRALKRLPQRRHRRPGG